MSSFSALFPSPVVVDILTLFLTQPEEEYYQRSLAEKTGYSLAQVQYALERILESGLISSKKSGNRLYYSAITSHPAYNDLKQAFLKTVALGDIIKESLKPYEKQIQFAFVYGSIASSEERPDSDIDLFILGGLSLKDLAKNVSEMSKTLKREVNPIIYKKDTFKAKLAEKNRFAVELIDTPKIWLMGQEDEFRKLAE